MTEREVLPKEPRAQSVDQPRAPVRRRARLMAAFAVAAVSDILAAVFAFVPPLQWALDLATAAALFLILGRQWVLLPALIAEAIPGVAVFPLWLLVVASIALWGTVKPLRK
ncbi:MAG TPA: hypothetical protein VMV72_19930 [Verrucomicrobiae bacterium]|nr:hypothetical protein [Verrucomicrobiae bacterium]